MHRGLEYVECPVCGKRVIVNDIAGTFRRHGPRNESCPASGLSVEGWRQAEAHVTEHGG